jgi:signal peptide peptidase SppA
MKHSNVISSLENSAWYSTPEQAEQIRRVAEGITMGEVARLRAEFEQSELAFRKSAPADGYDPSLVRIKGSTAIVPIIGTIGKRMNLMTAFSGGVSTDMLASTFRALAADSRITNVILDVDSGGGSVQGVELATRALRELSKVKNTIAVANDMMCSAAYYIASAANKVYVTPSSTVGSIGVLMMLVDKSKQLADTGVSVKIVRSAEFKALTTGMEPITDEAIKKCEETVNKYHGDFVNAIAINRNITMEQAEQLADGRTYEGVDAVEAGLADGEMTLEEVVETVEANADALVRLDEATAKIAELMVDREAAVAQLESAMSEVETLKAELATMRADATAREAYLLVSAAITDGKIPAAKQDKYITMAIEKGIDTVADLFADIPVGATVPVGESINEAKAEVGADPNAALSEVEREIFAQFPSLRKRLS